VLVLKARETELDALKELATLLAGAVGYEDALLRLALPLGIAPPVGQE